MSLGFFHNRLDWINKALIKELKKTTQVEVIDINDYGLDTHFDGKFRHDLYVNRVYPSENSLSFNNLRFMLEVVRHIENLGKPIINGFDATYADFSKTESNNILEKYDVPTARTHLFPNKKAAIKASKNMKFPKIVKMDCGGKAKNIQKVDNLKQFKKFVSKLDHEHHLIHVEDFLKSKGYSTRVFVLDYKVVEITKRSLASGWLGNSAKDGSKKLVYENPPDSIKKICVKAAKVLKAKIVSFDVIETKNDAFIVDVNVTPVFGKDNVRFNKEYKPEVEIAKIIIKEYKKAL